MNKDDAVTSCNHVMLIYHRVVTSCDINKIKLQLVATL